MPHIPCQAIYMLALYMYVYGIIVDYIRAATVDHLSLKFAHTKVQHFEILQPIILPPTILSISFAALLGLDMLMPLVTKGLVHRKENRTKMKSKFTCIFYVLKVFWNAFV